MEKAHLLFLTEETEHQEKSSVMRCKVLSIDQNYIRSVGRGVFNKIFTSEERS